MDKGLCGAKVLFSNYTNPTNLIYFIRNTKKKLKMNNAVQIVTIKNKIPLFKGEAKAEKIELIQLEENGFELVSQKDLYQIGDEAIYIQPDYCLSDIPLFQYFIEGSYLGKNNRIRAKKFNFHRGDGNSIYSNGILLSFDEVGRYLEGSKNINIWKKNYDFNDLTTDLEITKYEEPEKDVFGSNIKGGSSIRFPEGIVRTDEENFNNFIHHIEKLLPTTLIGKMKIDGWTILLLALFFIGGFWVSKTFFSGKKAGPEEEAQILVEKIQQVSKLVTIEGSFVEYYDYENRPSFYNSHYWITDQFKKTVQLRVRAKVLVGYDLHGIQVDAYPAEKVMVISNLPEPEILAIDHDVDFFDKEATMFWPLSDEDYLRVSKGAEEQIRQAALRSDLIDRAKREGNELFDIMAYMVTTAGWSLEIEGQVVHPAPDSLFLQ